MNFAQGAKSSLLRSQVRVPQGQALTQPSPKGRGQLRHWADTLRLYSRLSEDLRDTKSDDWDLPRCARWRITDTAMPTSTARISPPKRSLPRSLKPHSSQSATAIK